MVHAQVSDEYIHFVLIYTTDHKFTVLPIKNLSNQDSEPTTPQLRDLFCLCDLQKATAHVETKALNMRHQSQKGFWGILVGSPQHQKGYLIYVPNAQKIASLHDILFDETFSSALSYASQQYSEALVMWPAVAYIKYATSSHEQTGNFLLSVHFEEGGLVQNDDNVTKYESILASIDE